MRLCAIFAFLIVAVLIGACSPTTAIRQAERERWGATVVGDSLALRSALHHDLKYIHSNGLVENEADFVASVVTGKIEYESFTPLQAAVIKRDGKRASANGIVKVDGRYEGTPFSVDLRYVSEYLKEGDSWELIFWESFGMK